MPIYEYKCTNCEKVFDIYCTIGYNNSKETEQCTHCKQMTGVRLVSLPSPAKFIGGGFYCNDYSKEER